MLIKRREPRLAEDELRPGPRRTSLRRLDNLSQKMRLTIAVATAGIILLGILVIPMAATLLTLKAAADDLRNGANRLEGKGLALTVSDTGAADAEFTRAEQRFFKAESGLRHDLGFRLLSALPLTRRQVEASIALARSAAHLAQAGHQGIAVANSLIKEKVVGPGVKGNPGDIALSVLQALTPKLDPLIRELNAAQTERTGVPSGWLFWPIQGAVTTFDSRVGGAAAGLSELRSIQPGLQSLLGANGPQLYMVLQQDSAEMRATGGFIGSLGFVGFDHGKMRPYESRSIEFLDVDVNGKPVLGRGGNPHVEPPAPFKLLIDGDSWELRDSNWSPDFPTSAKQAQFFLALESHQQLKATGVISIDPNLVASLLTVTGPVYVPETKQTITAENFFHDTLVDVHHGAGKTILSYAAKAITDRFSRLGPTGLLHMLSVVKRGCEGRSIQAYFDDPAAEAMVERYHCTGKLVPLTSDGVFVVDTNMGASKADFWVDRRFNLALQVRPDGSVRHTLRLHYDGSQLVPNGDLTLPYRDWLRVYLPASAHVVRVEGIGGHGLGPKTVSDLGRTVVQGWMEFGFRGSSDVTLVYDLNANPGAGVDTRHHLELYWQKQAGRVNDPIDVSLQLPAGWSLTETRLNGVTTTSSTIRTDLAVDRQFSFSYQPP